MPIAWRTPTLVAFRFSFLYLGLYGLATQLYAGVLLAPGVSLPALGIVWPMREVTNWVAAHVFGAAMPLVYSGNSGDTLFHWIQTCWLLVAALTATVLWSLTARHTEYSSLHKWFRLVVRFALAGQMFYYGMAKVIPTQFPPASLVTLLEPVGQLSLTDMLWTWIGASTPYQIVLGLAEVAGGLLLLTPQTTALGAIVCLADMIQVFALNMTYDFGLKQISFHLVLISLFLLAPDARRLTSLLVLGGAASRSAEPPLFNTARANRIALVAQIVFGVFLLAMHARIARSYWFDVGEPGGPKSALYGIWDVEELAVNGEVRLPDQHSYDRRWRRVVFDAPRRMAFQRTDDSFAHYDVAIDESKAAMTLTKRYSRNWTAGFTFARPAPDRLVLDGTMDGYRINLRLQRVALDTFRLLNSPFRLVRPPD